MYTNNTIELGLLNQEEMELVKDQIGADEVVFYNNSWYAQIKTVAKTDVEDKIKEIKETLTTYAESLTTTKDGMTITKSIYPYCEAVSTSEDNCTLYVRCMC